MEEFKDFFKELRDRVSNPLIGSFLISWLVMNWPIILLILFYKTEVGKPGGVIILISLVRGYLSFCTSFLFPLIFAMIYSYWFPKVKSFIRLRHATVKAQNESEILLRTDQQVVALSKYIEMLDQHTATQKKLSEIIKTQSEVHETNIMLTDAKNTAEGKVVLSSAALLKKEAELKTLKDKCNFRNFEGLWIATPKNSKDNTKERWEIGSNGLDINNESSFAIRQYVIDPVFNKITLELATFDLNGKLEVEKLSTYIFSFDDEFKYLKAAGDVRRMPHVDLERVINI